MNNIQKIAQELYDVLQPHCKSIYLGGSICEGIIQNVHDIDLIFFGRKPIDMCYIRRELFFYMQKHPIDKKYDCIQVRNMANEEHSYGSYINKKMILLIGEPINFQFDVINLHREEYKHILIETINKLNIKKIKNQKRWYQIVRGFYILKNNSYELSDKEKEIINIIHDQLPGWEQYKITADDILKY